MSSFASSLARILALVSVSLFASVAAADDVPDDGPESAPPPPAQPAPERPAPEQPPPEPPPVVDVAPAPPPPEPVEVDTAPRPRGGLWKGRHYLTLYAGPQLGETARDAGILTAPLTGQPGSIDYPAFTALDVDLEDDTAFGLRYGYQFRDPWAVELGLERMSSSLVDPKADPVLTAARVRETALQTQQQDDLIARLDAHSQPHDIDLTFFDLGLHRAFRRDTRLPLQVGGGIGWVASSADGPIVYERLVTSDVIGPNDPIFVANEVAEVGDPPLAAGQCHEDTDPCIEMEAHGGLTWHLGASLGVAFTPSIQLNLGVRFRFIEQILDPGDSFRTSQATIGLRFLFGGM